jgi:hypothetical protein
MVSVSTRSLLDMYVFQYGASSSSKDGSVFLCSQVKVTLRRTVSQSVSQSWCQAPSGAHDQIFITVWHLRYCFCGASSLRRGRVCHLYMLLALASAVFLGSESLWTHDHILLSQIWDFPFHRLLRLTGSRWRYSTPPPHGFPLPTSATFAPYIVPARITQKTQYYCKNRCVT